MLWKCTEVKLSLIHIYIVKVIHQENGGHGEGVNQGIRNASGMYFKVVDSDDWLDAEALDVYKRQHGTGHPHGRW